MGLSEGVVDVVLEGLRVPLTHRVMLTLGEPLRLPLTVTELLPLRVRPMRRLPVAHGVGDCECVPVATMLEETDMVGLPVPQALLVGEGEPLPVRLRAPVPLPLMHAVAVRVVDTVPLAVETVEKVALSGEEEALKLPVPEALLVGENEELPVRLGVAVTQPLLLALAEKVTLAVALVLPLGVTVRVTVPVPLALAQLVEEPLRVVERLGLRVPLEQPVGEGVTLLERLGVLDPQALPLMTTVRVTVSVPLAVAQFDDEPLTVLERLGLRVPLVQPVGEGVTLLERLSVLELQALPLITTVCDTVPVPLLLGHLEEEPLSEGEALALEVLQAQFEGEDVGQLLGLRLSVTLVDLLTDSVPLPQVVGEWLLVEQPLGDPEPVSLGLPPLVSLRRALTVVVSVCEGVPELLCECVRVALPVKVGVTLLLTVLELEPLTLGMREAEGEPLTQPETLGLRVGEVAPLPLRLPLPVRDRVALEHAVTQLLPLRLKAPVLDREGLAVAETHWLTLRVMEGEPVRERMAVGLRLRLPEAVYEVVTLPVTHCVAVRLGEADGEGLKVLQGLAVLQAEGVGEPQGLGLRLRLCVSDLDTVGERV